MNVTINLSFENYKFITERISSSHSVTLDDTVNTIIQEFRLNVLKDDSEPQRSPSDLELATDALGAGMKPEDVTKMLNERG